METTGNNWIMHGLRQDDPKCIRTVEEAMDFIESVGFLPLFENEIAGFSLEEHTAADFWWTEDPRDPWMWREVIARSGRIAYGKFFGKKAGFISKEWFPVFANYRRDGYDFDALYEDGKAPMRHKKIMNHFMDDRLNTVMLSNELKERAGFGKGGEKGFEGAIASLMMQTYLCNCDFRKRKNKKGEEYGWNVAAYTSPENLWGYAYVTAGYREDPEASRLKLVKQMQSLYPEASGQMIQKLIKG